MLMILAFVLIVLGLLLGSYIYGVAVGLKEGRKQGVRKADAEWALRLEHGAV